MSSAAGSDTEEPGMHRADPAGAGTERTGGFSRPTGGRGGLRGAAVSGVKWTVIQSGGSRLTTIVVFIALSHLLAPAEFGVVALANVFIAFLGLIVEGGFGQAIIQRADLRDGHADSVFWLSLVTSVVLAGVLIGVAPPVAHVLHEPALAPILQVLSAGLVITSLSTCQVALLRRALRFKPLAIRSVLANIVGSGAGLIAAFLGAGAWALVIQFLTYNAVQTVTLWWFSGWRPGSAVSRRFLSEVFGFSRSSLIQSFLNFAGARSDDFLIGTWLGSVALGFYSVGFRLLSTLSDLINSVLFSVAFPIFSRLQRDTAALRRAYRTVLRLGTTVSFPTYLIFVVIAGDVVRVFFGDRWAAAAPAMRFLAMFGAIQTALNSFDQVLNAAGRQRVVWRYRLAYIVVQVAGFAVTAPFGITWVAMSLAARAYLMLPLPLYFMRQAGICDYRTFLVVVRTPLIVTGLMLAAAQTAYLTVLADVGPTVRLAVVVPLAAAFYLGVTFVVDRSAVRDVTDLLRRQRPLDDHGGPRRPRSAQVAAPTGRVDAADPADQREAGSR